MNSAVFMLVTAVLSSVLTIVMLGVIFKVYIMPQLEKRLATLTEALEISLDQRIEQASQQIYAETQQGLNEAIAETLPLFRTEMQTGFEEAAEALLPKFRQEVSAGFQETAEEILPAFQHEIQASLTEIPKTLIPFLREEIERDLKEIITAMIKGDFVDKAAKRMVKTGSSLVETGLTLLRNTRPNNNDG